MNEEITVMKDDQGVEYEKNKGIVTENRQMKETR